MTSSAPRFTQFVNNLNNKFEPHVRQHLARVYSCLAATTVCATIGAILHITNILECGLITALGSLGLILGLHFVRDNGKNFYTRLGMLLAFGFCSGQTLGPLLQIVITINPQIVVNALIGTCVVFVSFSLSALLAERGRYLFLGGILVSILSSMALVSLFNMFMQSHALNQVQLYVGLGVMSAFILYDTQSIIEKRRMGNTDCIQHSLDLFFDMVSVFRRLLIILTQKEERDNRRKKN